MVYNIGMPKNDPILSVLKIYLSKEFSLLRPCNVLLLGTAENKVLPYLSGLLQLAHIWVTDITYSSVIQTVNDALTMDRNSIHVFPDLSNPDAYLDNPPARPFDSVLLVLPKGRKVARRWLLQSHQCLGENGLLYLVGTNDEGVQSVAKDAADLFGSADMLGYKQGARLYRAEKKNSVVRLHDWTHQPGIAPGTWNEFQVDMRGFSFTIHTLPGVFSFDHLDEGTQMLLECMQVPSNGKVLDIGCGCGIIGILAAHLGAGHVDLADDHLLSVSSALENLKINGISSARVYASDLYVNLPDVKYDAIFSNPPFHSGKEVNYQITNALIAGGYAKLKPGGSLVIVTNRFIRYDRLMNQIFNNVSTLQENQRFHILSSQKL